MSESRPRFPNFSQIPSIEGGHRPFDRSRRKPFVFQHAYHLTTRGSLKVGRHVILAQIRSDFVHELFGLVDLKSDCAGVKLGQGRQDGFGAFAIEAGATMCKFVTWKS